MSVTCPLLLCLLSALVEVHSQTVPYVSFMGTNLPNHSYVDLNLVGEAQDGSDSVQCHTDLSTCCSSTQGSARGDWFFPDGNKLPLLSPVIIFESRGDRHVSLRYRGSGDGTPVSGIYCCTIETTGATDREIVYAGVYASGGLYVYISCYPPFYIVMQWLLLSKVAG